MQQQPCTWHQAPFTPIISVLVCHSGRSGFRHCHDANGPARSHRSTCAMVKGMHAMHCHCRAPHVCDTMLQSRESGIPQGWNQPASSRTL